METTIDDTLLSGNKAWHYRLKCWHVLKQAYVIESAADALKRVCGPLCLRIGEPQISNNP